MGVPAIYSFTKITDGSKVIYKPLVPIRIVNPADNSFVEVGALLDTGADACVFPKWVAEATNHNLKGSGVISSITQGVGAGKIGVWKHTFRIEILTADRTKVFWKSKDILIDCLDHDAPPVLIGWEHIMSNFKTTFNFPTKKILIELP